MYRMIRFRITHELCTSISRLFSLYCRENRVINCKICPGARKNDFCDGSILIKTVTYNLKVLVCTIE